VHHEGEHWLAPPPLPASTIDVRKWLVFRKEDESSLPWAASDRARAGRDPLRRRIGGPRRAAGLCDDRARALRRARGEAHPARARLRALGDAARTAALSGDLPQIHRGLGRDPPPLLAAAGGFLAGAFGGAPQDAPEPGVLRAPGCAGLHGL